ncbi:MAG: tetratricopeptide repeat protein, partial [Bacteroidales bacterium]|nr:tetratricopeptide repeat protein [Bacteroidales bacterium]
MKIKYYFLTIFLSYIGFGYAQNTKRIDSLEKILQNNKEEKIYIIKNLLAEELYQTSPDKAMKYSSEALAVAEQKQDIYNQAFALINIGKTYKTIDSNSKAIVNFNKAINVIKNSEEWKLKLRIYKELSDVYLKTGDMKNGFLFARNYLELSLRNGSPLDIGEAYDFLGTAYSFIDDYNYSLKCYLKALNIFEELKHKKNIATTLNNIGVIYFYLNNYVKAYEFFNKALNNIDKSKSMNLKADITNNLGSVYDEWHNYNKALKYYNEALNIFILLNNRSGIATVYNNIGLAWLKKYDYAKALNFCFKALTINKKTGEQYGIANTYNNIALISLKQKNYAPVGLYLDSAIIIEKKINSKILLKEAYKIYCDLFIIKEDYKQVFNYYKKYAEINDSLQNAINYKKISE